LFANEEGDVSELHANVCLIFPPVRLTSEIRAVPVGLWRCACSCTSSTVYIQQTTAITAIWFLEVLLKREVCEKNAYCIIPLVRGHGPRRSVPVVRRILATCLHHSIVVTWIALAHFLGETLGETLESIDRTTGTICPSAASSWLRDALFITVSCPSVRDTVQYRMTKVTRWRLVPARGYVTIHPPG
jgi:hypothetical protein